MKSLPLAFLLAITALRLCLAATLEVTPLEAYYWMCANQLDAAFFDGPAGTAFLVRLGFLAFGNDPVALRFAFPLVALLATVGAWLAARRLFNPTAGLWTAVALNLLPAFNIAAIHAGPALPALAAILFAIWAALVALDRGLFWWIAAGVWTAVAVQFRYDAMLAVIGWFLACACTHRHRLELARPGIHLAAVLAIAGLIPAFRWNQQHDWAPLAIGTLQTAFTAKWSALGATLATNGAMLSALAGVLLLGTLVPLALSARRHVRPRLLLALVLPFLAAWTYFLLVGAVATLPLLVSAALVSAGLIHLAIDRPWLRWTATGAGLAAAAASALSLASPTPSRADPWRSSSHGISWLRVAAAVETLIADAQKDRPEALFIIAQDPDATAALNYHLPRLAEGAARTVFLRESQDLSNQFGLWPRYDDFVRTEQAPDEFFRELQADNPYRGRSAIYVTTEAPSALPQAITSAFGAVVPVATLGGGGGSNLHVYLCEDYQTMPL